MRIIRTVPELREALAPVRSDSRVGFVPTMGALHEGHAALFAAARANTGVVVASVFVNPTQFNDPADLAAYPRDEERDAQMADETGVDVLFAPSAAEMYPAGFATSIEPAGVALGFEADHRPGHFAGVATVCLKFFTIVAPAVAYFGQKDAQQVAVIRQLVRDLNLPLDVHVVPTVRETGGLALSSRNARLSPEEKARALTIPRALRAGLAAFRTGADPAAAARAALAGFVTDYVGVASFDEGPTLVLAVRVGRTRLIDNVPLERPALAGLADDGH